MSMELKIGRTAAIVVPLTFFFFFFLCLICAANFRHGTSHSDVLDSIERRTNSYIQGEEAVTTATSRRYLSGPGSHPPECTAKCGDCTPCSPVLVTVPPETLTTIPYYPQVWRCKCGDQIYVP